MRLVTGLQPVREAIRVHGDKLDVLVDEHGGPNIDAVARFAQDRGCKLARVRRAELDRASKGARHQGAIAYAPDFRLATLDELARELSQVREVLADEPPSSSPGAFPLSARERSLASKATTPSVIVALDEIEDPQNFGAVIRSAVALGASAILWPEHHAAPLSPATFRASAGAVEHATLCRVAQLPNALDALKDAGARVVGLDHNAEHELSKVELDGPVVLVVGAEGKGLRKPVKRACTDLARLPMKGPIESLNASVAAGIALYEVMRRRS